MIELLLWPLAGLLCCALVLSYPLVIRPQLDRRHHARTLANIARLERELGFDVPLEQRIDRELLMGPRPQWFDSVVAGGQWIDNRRLPDREPADGWEPAERVYGNCKVCGLHVALNAGKCRGQTTDRIGNRCAKLEYVATSDNSA